MVKRTTTLLLVFALLLGCMPAMAVNASGTNAVSNGAASSVITVDVEPTQMTVTVPSVLPAKVDTKGDVTVASDAKVINKSYGPVEVTSIKAEPVSPWQLVGYGYNFSMAKVNSKLVQISIDGGIAEADGVVPLNGNWVILGGNQTYPFDYNIKISAQRNALASTHILNVVFTVDWYRGGGNTASSTEYSLSLDKDYLTMYPGTAEQVHATTTSETMVAMLAAENADDVSWSTSNANVVSVTDGYVEAKNVGTAVIKAEYHGLTATCVAAVAEAPVPLQAIEFSKNKLVLRKGESETILLNYNPEKFSEKADVYTSLSNNILTVNPQNELGAGKDGPTQFTITGNETGTCTITAEALVIGHVVHTTIDVEVFAPLESLSVSINNNIIECDNGGRILTATRVPSNNLSEIIWTSSNPDIATVGKGGRNDAVVFGHTPGEAVITATCDGISASVKVTVLPKLQSLTIEGPSTVEEGSKITLTAVKTPGNAFAEIEWLSDNENIATVDQDGVVTGVGVGETTIKAVYGQYEYVGHRVTVTSGVPQARSLKITVNNGTIQEYYSPQEDGSFKGGTMLLDNYKGATLFVEGIGNIPSVKIEIRSTNTGNIVYSEDIPMTEMPPETPGKPYWANGENAYQGTIPDFGYSVSTGSGYSGYIRIIC